MNLMQLLFGEPEEQHKERRKLIHDNNDQVQVSIAKARKATKVASEAERIAQCAIQRLEQSNNKKKDENDRN